MKYTLSSILTLCIVFAGLTQVRMDRDKISNKSILYDRISEARFARQVKNINEFIERFNYSETTLLRQYLSVTKPNAVTTRQQFINELFFLNHESKDTLKQQFVKAICDTIDAQYLNFYQKYWYAEANCVFYNGNKLLNLSITLKIKKTPNGGSKWVIAGMSSNGSTPKSILDEADSSANSKVGISPNSHVLNFLSLVDVFEDEKNILSYLDDSFLSPITQPIIKSILEKKLQFRFVKNVQYHFLQIKGWIFTVEEFQKNESHSGWLISSLQPASDSDKLIYKKAFLHLTSEQ